MKTRHTPGPWDTYRCTDESCYFAPHWDVFVRQKQNLDGSWYGIGVASIGASSTDPIVGEADARLIAAAPEMYSTLYDCLGAAQVQLLSLMVLDHLTGEDAEVVRLTIQSLSESINKLQRALLLAQ